MLTQNQGCGRATWCNAAETARTRCAVDFELLSNVHLDTFHPCSIFTSSTFSCRDLWGQSCQAVVPKRLGGTHACFFHSFSFPLLVFSPFPLLSLILLSSSLELLFTAFPSFMPGGRCAQQRSLVPSVSIRCISMLIHIGRCCSNLS